MELDMVRPGDRELVMALQKESGCEFPVPDPLNGFVVRENGELIGWAGWEMVAEVFGVVHPSLSVKEKARIWASLHKPIEERISSSGVSVAYVQVKKEHGKFASLLNFFGWSFCPGYWLRRERGTALGPKGLNSKEELSCASTAK